MSSNATPVEIPHGESRFHDGPPGTEKEPKKRKYKKEEEKKNGENKGKKGTGARREKDKQEGR